MPVEPEAPPWFTLVAVSPMITLTALNGTSSSSATIWPMAVNRPWPMSILPKKADTLPSALTAMKEASWSGISGGLVADACAWATLTPSTASSVIGAPSETTSAPEALRTERRENVAGLSILIMISSSAHHLGRALDRAHDVHVRPATALEAGERILDLGVARLLVAVEQRRRSHDPPLYAVSPPLLLAVGLRDRMRLLGRAEAGECHPLAVADRRHRRHAGADRLAVEMHRAGAALREPAAEVRVVEPDVVAQGIEQRHVRIGIDRI